MSTVVRVVSGQADVSYKARGAVKNEYVAACQAEFAPTCRLYLGWDGSCHGGRDTIVGNAINIDSGKAAYTHPLVPSSSSN